MILVDASIWIGHFRKSDRRLEALLNAAQVLSHPFIIGEIALGNLPRRELVLSSLEGLPHALIATHAEAMSLLERHRLSGLGIGYIDLHLLAAARLTPGAQLWTADVRLGEAAARLDVSPPTLPAG